MYSQKLPNGKFRFFESYLEPMTMIRKTTSVTMDKNTAQTRRAAQELLSAKIMKLETLSSDVKGMTLRGLLDAYEEGVKGLIREQTRIRNVRENEKMVEILGEKTQVNKLTIRYIVSKIAETDWKPVTKNERVKRFRALIRWGYKMGYVRSAEYVSALPHYEDNKAARREDKYLEPSELQTLLDAMPTNHNKQITQFMALTGMRIGEVVGLKNEDIDIDRRVIHVLATHSTITREDGPTKTDGSTRDIYIQSELLELLGNIEKGDKYLFEKKGMQINYFSYLKCLKVTSERALGREVTTHILRHTHTSLLAQNHMDLEAIAKRLGHKDSKVTREVYLHVTAAMKKEENDLLDGTKLL